MAVDYFLKLDGIEGESVTKGHKTRFKFFPSVGRQPEEFGRWNRRFRRGKGRSGRFHLHEDFG